MKRLMFKSVNILLVLVMALGLFASFPSTTHASTPRKKVTSKKNGAKRRDAQIWASRGASTSAWFRMGDSKRSSGSDLDPETIRVGKTSRGKDIFSLLRLPMRSTLLRNEIKSARLYLKISKGKAPSALRIGLMKDYWGGVATLADAKKLTNRKRAASVAVRKEKDGWVSVDVKKFVLDWVGGDVPNNGLVLLGKRNGRQTSFVSGWDGGSKNSPRLEVTGSVSNRDLSYGKFGYLRHPKKKSDDKKIAKNETANCLSYALRDTDVIGQDELKLDYGEMTKLYRKSGEDAVAEYCAQKTSEYVERNKAALKISNFRRIENFDSAIDATKEYRMAFRVGCKIYDKNDVLDDALSNFDYHVWAQINTGQWAQKFMFEPTEIVPGTPPGVSPGKYPWDSLQWDWEKYHGFHTSKVIYFAVTKDADGFTRHKGK